MPDPAADLPPVGPDPAERYEIVVRFRSAEDAAKSVTEAIGRIVTLGPAIGLSKPTVRCRRG